MYWTDIMQAIAAIIAIPGAIAAFVMLFIRDKKREAEIHSLSEIANKLTQMHQDSEGRYKNSKKPIIEIETERFEDAKVLRLMFRNTNSNTTIKSFSIRTEFPGVTYEKDKIGELKGQQVFSADLRIKSFNFQIMTLGIEYVTEENYRFFHYFSIEWIRKDKIYVFHLTPMMDKGLFHYLANDERSVIPAKDHPLSAV